MPTKKSENHRSLNAGWLRAAVLGADDGIVSTSSLLLGVAAANSQHSAILLAGTAALVAGAMSMAAGEYVSVSSQADTEQADILRERSELKSNSERERHELTEIYVNRGLDRPLAMQVAEQLMAKDALGAHIRDELGISEVNKARPLQAALASAASFAVGAAVPLAAALLSPHRLLIAIVSSVSLVSLAVIGALAARTGGAPLLVGSARVLFWGALAMGATAGVGALFGAPAG